jgi:16S rRNA (cytosine967-C5)-methyltransferase
MVGRAADFQHQLRVLRGKGRQSHAKRDPILMTPSARLSAAIAVLDRILAGAPVEQTLVNWGRANRYAGSGDRHAIGDLVFDGLRNRRSYAALGGGLTGRGLVLGGVRADGRDPAELFTGVGHAPPVVGPQEGGRSPQGAEALDVPDWLEPGLKAALGAEYEATMAAMRRRAPVFLRVNLARISRDDAVLRLAGEGIAADAHPLASSALQVTAGERKIQTSGSYLEGLIELQDASSQAVVDVLELRPGLRVLDYCAGGGGKTLAMAARGVAPHAHDINATRMKDLPDRAKRAGAKVKIVHNPAQTAPYDLILIDAPCSGSGSWRRDPQGKWLLTADRLAELLRVQADILDRAVALLHGKGSVAYATCSFLGEENEAQVAAFLRRHPDFRVARQQRFGPLQGGDGFFVALLTRADAPTTQL